MKAFKEKVDLKGLLNQWRAIGTRKKLQEPKNMSLKHSKQQKISQLWRQNKEDPDQEVIKWNKRTQPKPINHQKFTTPLKKIFKQWEPGIERKRKEKKKGFTGKVELVGRIKTKPPPCGEKRLGHGRHSVWRLKKLVTLVLLLMNSLQRWRSRRRRRSGSAVRLPKRHFTQAPDFLFRERLLTVNSHSSVEIPTQIHCQQKRIAGYFLKWILWGDRLSEVVCMAFFSV